MFRDNDGNLVQPHDHRLAKADPKTEKISVYIPPQGMSPTGGAVTVDVDGKGFIWASSPIGALRFDPKTETFMEFKSLTYKTVNGTGVTYGAAADRDGNGWWAEMVLDIIGKGNVATGKAEEVRLAPVQAELDRDPRGKEVLRGFTQPDFNTPLPWSQGRAAWAPTRTPMCCGSATRGATASRASIPRAATSRSCRCPA
jgi:streptogramin lyase